MDDLEGGDRRSDRGDGSSSLDLFTSLLESDGCVLVFYLFFSSGHFTKVVPFEEMKSVAPGTTGMY
jgi:hypothetical protein